MIEENMKIFFGLSFFGIIMVVWVELIFNFWVLEGEIEVKVIVIFFFNLGVLFGIMVMISRDFEFFEKKYKVKNFIYICIIY